MALLKKFDPDLGTISVTRSKRDGNLAYFQNGCFHSQAKRDGTSLCVYVHLIQDIIRQSHARNILIIGCAGGTLATMLRRLHIHVTIVDINPTAFVIARRYFKLPAEVRCVRRDGIEYLRTTHKRYDAVVVDVFDSNNGVPRAFTDSAFFARLRKILTPAGLMVMNVITQGDTDRRADIIARHAEMTGMDITLFDWPGHQDRNSLIVGGLHRRIHLPSPNVAPWIKPDMEGLLRRKLSLFHPPAA